MEADLLRCLRRPTRVSLLEARVPRPRGGVPERGLPLWYDTPLDRPLPLLLPTQDSVVFTRGKLGRKLRKAVPGHEQPFVLTDPLLRNVPSLGYEPLHDEDLRDHFSRGHVRAHLKKAGLITAEGDVLCSYKQFAQYRRYLGSLHRQAVAAEIRCQEEARRAARQLSAARSAWLEARRNLVPARIDGLSETFREEKCCVGDCRTCRCACTQQEPAADTCPPPLFALPWSKLKPGRRQPKVTREWLQRSIAQLKTKHRNGELLRRSEEEMRHQVARLRAAYRRQWSAMEEKIRRAKWARENVRSEQFVVRTKRMSAAFVKAWQDRVDGRKSPTPAETLKLLQSMPAEDSFYALLEAKHRLERLRRAPEAVTSVIDELVDSTVLSFTVKQVTRMVEEVLERLTQRVSRAKESAVAGRTSQVLVDALRRRSIDGQQPTEEKSEKVTQTSQPECQKKEEISSDPLIRFQVPHTPETKAMAIVDTSVAKTPAPSVTQLVEAVFEEDLPRQLPKVSFRHHTKLKEKLRTLASFLRDSIVQMPENKIRALKKKVVHKDYSASTTNDLCITKVSEELANAIMKYDLKQVMESKEIQNVIDCLLYKLMKVAYEDMKDQK
ncbi:uncharacterized protein LOC134530596 [Bacillus rossius redtenbacheri]|uniref:uncharacterized protein LOC134530596 n=1 Tax=Bacillus rossius redtenbacheri TaxID=93214 RepID=UPI002FDD1BD9